ncbi:MULTISPECIES: MEDS domain-containing protein [Alteribacter]|nr:MULTISPECIES: MEDS domain-containing protein [Alteribacter]MBM7097479.1 MEDS domain-containing protein [Alteribacter salitolerans]
MHKFISASVKRMREGDGGHIFYKFNDSEAYLNNAVTFILEGVNAGDDVAVIESERIMPALQSKLNEVLTEKQQKKIHYMNNFQFYLFNGNFHIHKVQNYFSRLIEPYEGEIPGIRTWAHVEWGEDSELQDEVAKFEEIADEMVSENKLISVCAYSADRICEKIEDRLQRCHPFLMTDNNLVPCERYKKLS